MIFFSIDIFSTFIDIQVPPLAPNIFFCFLYQDAVFFLFLLLSLNISLISHFMLPCKLNFQYIYNSSLFLSDQNVSISVPKLYSTQLYTSWVNAWMNQWINKPISVWSIKPDRLHFSIIIKAFHKCLSIYGIVYLLLLNIVPSRPSTQI